MRVVIVGDGYLATGSLLLRDGWLSASGSAAQPGRRSGGEHGGAGGGDLRAQQK